MESRYTKVLLRGVEVSARIGLAAWERETPQRLIANIELYAEAKDYLGSVKPNTIIDYCPIYDLIQSWRLRAHTELLETLVTDLVDACFECLEVDACRISVLKPQVLDWAAAAGVEVYMTRKDYDCSSAGQLHRARMSGRFGVR
jgi:dihydroneopterin aldolase